MPAKPTTETSDSMPLVAPHITAYLRERLPVQQRASSHTCDAYAYGFQLLLGYASEQLGRSPSGLELEQLDAPLILAFLDHLQAVRRNGPATRNARLAAIKSFMRFVEYRVPSALDQIARVLAIPTQKTDTLLVCHLTAIECQAILDAPDPTTRLGIRDRVMLHLAIAGGLRASELVGLRSEAVAFEGRYADIRILGKGRRERVLKLWKVVADSLRTWAAVRGYARTPEFFINAHAEAMTRSGFKHIVAKHVASATATCPSLAQKRISPHVFRHTCALNILQATGDIRKVALWLGHASVQTTEIYLQLDPTQKLAALASTTPPSLRPGRFRPPDRLIAMLRPDAEAQSYAPCDLPAIP